MPEMILLRMKTAGPIAISRCYLGEFEDESDDKIVATRVCAVFEQIQQAEENGRKVQEIVNVFQTTNIFSRGEVEFRKSEIEFTRMVDEGDTLLKGYHDSFVEFDKVKSSLIEIPDFTNKGKK